MHLNGEKSIIFFIFDLSKVISGLMQRSRAESKLRCSFFKNAWMIYGRNKIINGDIQALSRFRGGRF